MVLLESITHSFILKVWLEVPSSGTDPALWRGHITHVSSQQRLNFDKLCDIEQFITPFLLLSEQEYQKSED
ncbi:MAG: hypothetical protein DHS20C20_26010 [Ardenticatenaceae bacterium]|nr:MAG: hypothetical protein DHS20C20_26010 [Ardenticatenaceae bacterium]